MRTWEDVIHTLKVWLEEIRLPYHEPYNLIRRDCVATHKKN